MSKEAESGAQSDPQERGQTAVAFDSKNISRKADNTEYFTKVDGAARLKRQKLREERKRLAKNKRLAKKQERAKKRAQKKLKSRKLLAAILAVLLLAACIIVGLIIFRVNKPNPDEPEPEYTPEETAVVPKDEDELLDLTYDYDNIIDSGDIEGGIEKYQKSIDATEDPVHKAMLYAARANILFALAPDDYREMIFADLIHASELSKTTPYECRIVQYANILGILEEYQQYTEACETKQALQQEAQKDVVVPDQGGEG